MHAITQSVHDLRSQPYLSGSIERGALPQALHYDVTITGKRRAREGDDVAGAEPPPERERGPLKPLPASTCRCALPGTSSMLAARLQSQECWQNSSRGRWTGCLMAARLLSVLCQLRFARHSSGWTWTTHMSFLHAVPADGAGGRSAQARDVGGGGAAAVASRLGV